MREGEAGMVCSGRDCWYTGRNRLSPRGMLMTATAADHPSPTEPSAPNPSCPPPQPQTEEVDVWWGSYAGRTMWRSFLGCLLATGVVSWLTWAWLPADLFKLGFVTLAGAIWVIQGIRW